MNEIYGKTRFRGAIGEATLPRDFAILTAFATTGETWSAERNLRANELLRAELQGRGCWMVEATGYSPEDGHAEPGWAIELCDASLKDESHLLESFACLLQRLEKMQPVLRSVLKTLSQ